jgi:hypothetical protein
LRQGKPATHRQGKNGETVNSDSPFLLAETPLFAFLDRYRRIHLYA